MQAVKTYKCPTCGKPLDMGIHMPLPCVPCRDGVVDEPEDDDIGDAWYGGWTFPPGFFGEDD